MYSYVNIPEITDDIKFEDLALDLYNKILLRAQKNGRPGQRQDGVDIYGYTEKSELIGIQCKVKSKADFMGKSFRNKFEKEIKEEIIKARSFSPNLSTFIIMTTAPRDSIMQTIIRNIDYNDYKKNGFHIQIMYWDDISNMLTEEIHKETFKKDYGNLISERVVGDVKAKLLSLIVGVENRSNSLYQLILGYIPKIVEYPNGIEYYSNSYFLSCLQARTLDTIPDYRCFPSDLDLIFYGKFEGRDKYIISDWINSINIDDEIISDTREYNFYWNKEQFEDYRSMFRDD